jgi:hypothetical protein
MPQNVATPPARNNPKLLEQIMPGRASSADRATGVSSPKERSQVTMMEAGSLQPPVSPLVPILRTRTQIVAPGSL